jgi:hypothetical protein
MAPIPTSDKTRQLRDVPGSHLKIGANQDTSCFSIYDDESTLAPDDRGTVIIHVCDWPALLGAVAQLMQDRADDMDDYYQDKVGRETGR